jgi:lysophospholipase L1-like esterase
MSAGHFSSYVALGDSFTEGMDDPRGDGTYRGFADLVAGRLAEKNGGFRYANLAVRGKLLGRVVNEQLPAAVEMAPDLVSFAAGGNDALRRRFDPDAIGAGYAAAIGRLRATGAAVVVFTPADGTGHLPGRNYLLPRCEAIASIVRDAAKEHGALVVDLWGDDGLRDRRMWSVDRLHLSVAGHHRVAAHVLEALGVEPDPAWRAALPTALPPGWYDARRDDLQWAWAHLAPWIGRRLRGRSSGDNITAKRPILDAFLG